MTCYASPAGHGFVTHFDCQPSFVLQLEGSKRWRFSAAPAVQWPPTALPNGRVAEELRDRYPWLDVRFPDEAERAAFLEQVLTPGDALFLPAGTWHEARAIGCSLALTMSCIPMSAADFVDDLIRGHLSNSVDWRRNLPPVPMERSRPDRLPPAVKRFFDARLSELRRHVRSLRAEDLYETWAHHVASFDTPFRRDGPQPADRLKVTDTLAVADAFPLRYVARPGDGSVSLYYLDHRIDLRYDTLPLIRTMLARSAFPAHAAKEWLGPRFEWRDVEPALRELVRARILRVGRGRSGTAVAPDRRGSTEETDP